MPFYPYMYAPVPQLLPDSEYFSHTLDTSLDTVNTQPRTQDDSAQLQRIEDALQEIRKECVQMPFVIEYA